MEGAVKGHNGIVLNGEKRSLNADENNLCGDDEKGRNDDGHNGDEGHLMIESRVTLSKALAECVEVIRSSRIELGPVDPDHSAQEVGEPPRDLRSSPVKNDRLPCSVKGALKGR